MNPLQPLSVLFRAWWRFADKKRAVISLCFFIGANITILAEPLLLGWFFNTVQTVGIGTQTIRPLMFALVGLIALRAIFWAMHGPGRIFETDNAYLERVAVRKYYLQGVMSLPSKWHTDRHSGETIDRVEKAATAIFKFSGRTYEIIELIVRILGSYFALIYFNVHASYLVGIMFIIYIIVVVGIDQKLVPRYRAMQAHEHTISAKVYDALANIQTVIILRVEALLSHQIFIQASKLFGYSKSTYKLNETKWFLLSMITTGLGVSVLGAYVLIVYHTGQVAMIGTMVLMYQYVDRIGGQFFRFAGRYDEILQQYAAISNVAELDAAFTEHGTKTDRTITSSWKVIDAKRIMFSYHDSKTQLHLNNAHLALRPGQKIAFVGESGSGKTTMLKLIRGLYEPSSIDLTIDGNSQTDGFHAIAGSISLIPQDAELFNTTVRDNITFGIDHEHVVVIAATDMACVTQVIQRLPKRFDSTIKEKGVNLSGGEKQRLALARGLLAARDKPILLMDEPTSSIDAKHERIIYENIFREYREKTIISTVHRLHLLDSFDVIYYFHQGNIVAHGSLEKLLKSCPQFHVLWKKYHAKRKE